MPSDGVADEFVSRGTLGDRDGEALIAVRRQRIPAIQSRTTLPRSLLPPAWLVRVEQLPPPYQRAAVEALADQHFDELVLLSEADAARLGVLFARSPTKAVAVATRALRRQGPWLGAFLRGFLSASPDYAAVMRYAASAWRGAGFKADALPKLDARDRRRLLEELAGLGDSNAFDMLERELVSIKGDPHALALGASGFRRAGIGCVTVLATHEDRQPAADVAVGLVEGLCAVRKYGDLDTALAAVNPRTVPVEVVLAFLMTAKRVREHLPAYGGLVSRLEAAMRVRKRIDVADIIPLLR